MPNNLKAAIFYYEKFGFSVIPVGKDKRPLLKWEPFQKAKADKIMLAGWFKKWPEANIGLVCGEISGITVLDADSEAAFNLLNEYLPESFSTPTAKTPKGKHLYFSYTPDFSNAVRLVSDIDIRNNGGYVVAPPSENGNGNKYKWLENLGPHEVKPQKMPAVLFDLLKQSSNQNAINTSYISSSSAQIESIKDVSKSFKSNIFTKGRRDDDLFRVANALIKSGMPENEVRIYLEFLAKNCDPPFDDKECLLKIDSALKREDKRAAITIEEVRNFLKVSKGIIKVSEVYQMVSKVSSTEKMRIRVILHRLVKSGEIEKVGKWDGMYRRIEDDSKKIDLEKLETREVDLYLPLDLHDLIIPQPKNIFVVAGERDSGKSCFCLNIARMNLNRGLNIRYLTSEMGGAELKSRLLKFEPETPFNHWLGCDFRECNANFQDSILPNGLNIIDYLKLEDSFYLIGGEIKRIFDKLENGIVIIALQKKFKERLGVGGQFTLDEARLYVTLSSNPPEGGIARIEKAKNWRRENFNPNQRECNFKIYKGATIQKTSEWVNFNERKAHNKRT